MTMEEEWSFLAWSETDCADSETGIRTPRIRVARMRVIFSPETSGDKSSRKALASGEWQVTSGEKEVTGDWWILGLGFAGSKPGVEPGIPTFQQDVEVCGTIGFGQCAVEFSYKTFAAKVPVREFARSSRIARQFFPYLAA